MNAGWPTSPPLSRLTLGTMAASGSSTSYARLLLDLADRGITSHHCSEEYESFPLYTEALALASRSQRFASSVQVMMKLAEPSWDDTSFDAVRFADSIQRASSLLGRERIDVVQWMVRTKTPSEDDVVLPIIEKQFNEIRGAADHAVATGIAGVVTVFPYTDSSARACFPTDTVGLAHGLATYFNPVEQRDRSVVDRVPTIAIRPFAGGTIPIEARSAALRSVVEHPNVVSAVVGTSSVDHADQLCAWLAEAGGVS